MFVKEHESVMERRGISSPVEIKGTPPILRSLNSTPESSSEEEGRDTRGASIKRESGEVIRSEVSFKVVQSEVVSKSGCSELSVQSRRIVNREKVTVVDVIKNMGSVCDQDEVMGTIVDVIELLVKVTDGETRASNEVLSACVPDVREIVTASESGVSKLHCSIACESVTHAVFPENRHDLSWPAVPVVT